MQVQSGVDLVRIDRIEKAIAKRGRRFLERIWTAGEQADCQMGEGQMRPAGMASLAARFAAKEAVAKALGTGIGPQGVCWTDIEIIRQESGQPLVRLKGAAARIFQAAGGLSISISLAHEDRLAMAYCVLLKQERS